MSTLGRINLLLAMAVLLLGLTYYFEPGLKPSQAVRVSGVNVEQVQRLKLYRQQKLEMALEIVLERQGDEWKRLPPLPDDCATPDCAVSHPELINQWLHIAELPSIHRFPAPIDRLQEFGLELPNYRLQLDDLTILVGGMDPGSRLRYLLVNGTIHLVSDSYTHLLKRDP